VNLDEYHLLVQKAIIDSIEYWGGRLMMGQLRDGSVARPGQSRSRARRRSTPRTLMRSSGTN
jgi:hypothetical protein